MKASAPPPTPPPALSLLSFGSLLPFRVSLFSRLPLIQLSEASRFPAPPASHPPPLFVLLIGVEMIETPTVPSSVCPLSTLGHTLHAVPTNRTFVCLIPLSFVLFTWSVSQSNLCKTISCRDVFYVQRVPIAYWCLAEG